MRAPLSAFAPGAALAREWLLRNDRGDVASGTASGVQVRLRHAALATTVAHGRIAPLLLRLDARAGDGHHVLELSWRPSDRRGQAHPRAAIELFTREPWPTWRYRVGETLIEKQLLLMHDYAALVSIWRHLEGQPLRLAVTPAVAVVGAPTPLAAEVEAGDGAADAAPGATTTPPEPLTVQAIPGRVRMALNGAHRLTMWHDGAFLPVRSWRSARDGAADTETWLAPGERGDVPGFVEAMLSPSVALHVVIATEEALLRRLAERERLGTPPPRSLAGCVAAIAAGERRRIDDAAREAIAAAGTTAREAWDARHAAEAAPAPAFDASDAWVARLARGLELCAARTAGVAGAPGPYVAAGGAEALRAVRGLVALRRYEPAREILLALGQLVREGVVPSSFDAAGAPRYESPEASLWLVIVTELFARRAGEHEFVRRALLAPLEQIIDRFRAGTRLGVRLRDDGLLACGDEGAARTDLNALWYSAQVAMGQLARSLGQKQSGAFYLAWAREHQARFNESLWDDALGAPYVAALPAGPVRGLEPSQLLAASLSPPLLAAERLRTLLGAVERELLMPAGLREAPGAPRILPGWMGHYLTAFVRAHGHSDEARARSRRLLAQLEAVLDRYAAGQLPDAFETDGDAALDGSPLQAAGEPVALAGTAELLRFRIEELDDAEVASPTRA